MKLNEKAGAEMQNGLNIYSVLPSLLFFCQRRNPRAKGVESDREKEEEDFQMDVEISINLFLLLLFFPCQKNLSSSFEKVSLPPSPELGTKSKYRHILLSSSHSSYD